MCTDICRHLINQHCPLLMCTLHLAYLEFRRNSNNSICTSNLNKLFTPLEKISEDWIVRWQSTDKHQTTKATCHMCNSTINFTKWCTHHFLSSLQLLMYLVAIPLSVPSFYYPSPDSIKFFVVISVIASPF